MGIEFNLILIVIGVGIIAGIYIMTVAHRKKQLHDLGMASTTAPKSQVDVANQPVGKAAPSPAEPQLQQASPPPKAAAKPAANQTAKLAAKPAASTAPANQPQIVSASSLAQALQRARTEQIKDDNPANASNNQDLNAEVEQLAATLAADQPASQQNAENSQNIAKKPQKPADNAQNLKKPVENTTKKPSRSAEDSYLTLYIKDTRADGGIIGRQLYLKGLMLGCRFPENSQQDVFSKHYKQHGSTITLYKIGNIDPPGTFNIVELPEANSNLNGLCIFCEPRLDCPAKIYIEAIVDAVNKFCCDGAQCYDHNQNIIASNDAIEQHITDNIIKIQNAISTEANS